MKILIVDDEDMQRDLLKGFLEKKGYDVLTAPGGIEALEKFRAHPVQLALLDQRMPDMSGEDVLREMKRINPGARSIMITAYGTIETAITVMKLGADDFLEKPVDLLDLLDKIEWMEQRIMAEEDVEEVEKALDRMDMPIRIIGEGSGMKEVLSLAKRIAPSPWTVLIRGETGTGKELLARLIHLLSPVSRCPFVEVNCGAIPESLFESELFGHEKGAFTGATSSRRGRFEQADGGVIFLDEIGELPLSLQPKLLRALQEKKISRIGSEKVRRVNTRVLAATNCDLKEMVKKGLFREDLYFRLNVFDLAIPPLRERKVDIPALSEFFLDKYANVKTDFHPEAMSALMKYSFPGNVRELEHVVQRTATLARGSLIREKDLPSEIRFYREEEGGTLAERLNLVEREMILTALEKNDWIQTKAADQLGISERVLRYKMKKQKIQNTNR